MEQTLVKTFFGSGLLDGSFCPTVTRSLIGASAMHLILKRWHLFAKCSTGFVTFDVRFHWQLHTLLPHGLPPKLALAPQFVGIYPEVYLQQTKKHSLRFLKRRSILQIAGNVVRVEHAKKKNKLKTGATIITDFQLSSQDNTMKEPSALLTCRWERSYSLNEPCSVDIFKSTEFLPTLSKL